MSDINQQIYQQLILEHNRKPRNFGKPATYTHDAEGYNPLCGDRYHVFAELSEDGKIKKISFDGQGCAISKASASLMTERLAGLTITETEVVFEKFRNLLKHGNSDEKTDDLGKLKIFSGIWQYPARVKCAALSWYALQAALHDEKVITTENKGEE